MSRDVETKPSIAVLQASWPCEELLRRAAPGEIFNQHEKVRREEPYRGTNSQTIHMPSYQVTIATAVDPSRQVNKQTDDDKRPAPAELHEINVEYVVFTGKICPR